MTAAEMAEKIAAEKEVEELLLMEVDNSTSMMREAILVRTIIIITS